jgi:imidazolonepropionase-like amidohydrolase
VRDVGGADHVRAARLGVRSIEHANLIDAETAEIVAKHAAYVVPTLATYDSLWRSVLETQTHDQTRCHV